VQAIWNCREVALASPRVGAMIGPSAEHADIARAVGYEWTPEGLETLYLRSRVLLACREAGIHAITGLWEDLANLDGLREFALQGRRLGFRGMIAIHPTHVATVNDVFTPSPEDVAFHEGMVKAYEAAAAEGKGALRYRGLHIDKAHYDKAVEWLERAARITGGTRTGEDR
jgi:citrate lyase subunit beta/citryl-CoA lyase